MPSSLLLRLLQNPNVVKCFSDKDWELCIGQARSSNMLARVFGILQENELTAIIPKRPLTHFNSSTIKVKRQQQQINFEINELDTVLSRNNIPAIILKGAAYVIANKSAKLGRTSSDIDLLVVKNHLAEVEKILCQGLWSQVKMEDYDQEYYRTWMHEIPPLIHIERQTVLDIHHNILPPTSSIINADKLITNKQAVAEFKACYTLSPADMTLHSATHLFHEGELSKGLRDLSDLFLLFNEFSENNETFYREIIQRAQEIGLTLPLFLAQRYCTKVLHIHFPKDFTQQLIQLSPSNIQLRILDFIYINSFIPQHSSCTNWKTTLASYLLYFRGHLLRMPLRLLIPHLAKKSWMQFIGLFKKD